FTFNGIQNIFTMRKLKFFESKFLSLFSLNFLDLQDFLVSYQGSLKFVLSGFDGRLNLIDTFSRNLVTELAVEKRQDFITSLGRIQTRLAHESIRGLSSPSDHENVAQSLTRLRVPHAISLTLRIFIPRLLKGREG